jgi:hypothetical protein
MPLTPGRRSPTTQPRPSASPEDRPRPPRPGRRPVWTRAASVSVLRLGVLIGGLVIIVDLLSVLLTRDINPDDAVMFEIGDQLVNYVLFSVLGILVARDTGLNYAGIFAGIFASLLDAVVVAAATLMAPTATSMPVVEEVFINNLVIGTVFAGVSGFVYSFMQRWSGGRRAR